MLRRKRFPGLLSILLILPLLSALPGSRTSKSETPPPFAPVYADLVGPLEARFLQPGSSVLLRVRTEWRSSACKLREGAILKGHVAAVNISSKTQRISQVALAFDQAECNGPNLAHMPLSVAAVLAPDPADGSTPQPYAPLNQELLAMGSGSGIPSATGGGGSGLRSVNAAAYIADISPMPVEPPRRMTLGDVVGLSGLKLSVGTGPEGSSVLSIKGRNVSLQRDTRFFLVPAAMLAGKTAPGST